MRFWPLLRDLGQLKVRETEIIKIVLAKAFVLFYVINVNTHGVILFFYRKHHK